MKRYEKMREFLRPIKYSLILSIVLLLVVTVMNIILPLLLGQAIDAIGHPDVFTILKRTSLWIVILVIIRSTCSVISNIIQQRSLSQFVYQMRTAAHQRMLMHPIADVEKRGGATYITRILQDSETIANTIAQGIASMITGILTIVLTLGIIFWIRPTLALLLILCTPPFLLTTRFIAKNASNYFAKNAQLRGELTSFTEEILTTRSEQALSGHNEKNRQMLHELTDRMYDAGLKAQIFSAMPNPTTRFLNAILYALITIYCAFGVRNGTLTIGLMLAFLKYTSQYIAPFYEITMAITQWQNAIVCAGRMEEYFQMPIDMKNLIDAPVSGETIVFDDVSFSYNDKPFMEGIDATVRAGEKIALVGTTGSGKTTLLHLISGLLRPTKGTISVGAQNTADWSDRRRHEQISVVLQDCFVKQGTIGENISYGNAVSRDIIMDAAKTSSASTFIERMPKGYDAEVREGGTNLSRGERQLLGIARAMINPAPILILDEATSDVDAIREQAINEAIDRLCVGRTVFVAAHRLATVQTADEIWVLQHGKIVERGRHKDLVTKRGVYYNLFFAKGEMDGSL